MDNKDLQKRVEDFKKEQNPLLKKYNLKIIAQLDLPMYKKYPLEVELAIEVLKKHGAICMIAFQEEVR